MMKYFSIKNICIFPLFFYQRDMVYFFMQKLYITFFISLITLIFSISPSCFVFAESDQQITAEDAQAALKEVIPNVKILEVRPTPVKGLWEIALEAQGQKGLVYLDSSKNYVISGSILNIKTKANITQERFSELTKINVDASQIPLDDALVLGEKDAKNRVIVFDDPE
jgi:protein-disulfide isomerase